MLTFLTFLNTLLLITICFYLSRLVPRRQRREACPACCEQISPEARICPYCRSDVIMVRAHPSSVTRG